MHPKDPHSLPHTHIQKRSTPSTILDPSSTSSTTRLHLAIRVRGSGPPSNPEAANQEAPNHNTHLSLFKEWACPECLMYLWAPSFPTACHRCGYYVHIDSEGASTRLFEIVPTTDGQCLACSRKGVSGQQCPECGGPIEPIDQSFHYQDGWRQGPRPQGLQLDFIPANFAKMHENLANTLIAQILHNLEGILSPPYSAPTKAIIDTSLRRLDNGHLTRMTKQEHPFLENAIARLVSKHLTNKDPRLACIASMLSIEHPAHVTALLGAASRQATFAKIISDDGTLLANQITVFSFINELSSWAQLKNLTLGSGHKIPDPFPQNTKYEEAQALINAALHDDSIGHDYIVTKILGLTTNPLRQMVLGHESFPRKALRSQPRDILEGLLSAPPCTINSFVANTTTELIANESRRLKTLRAFINLSQPAACYAMILTAETILSFDPYIDHRGILLRDPAGIRSLMEITCHSAKRRCISTPTFTHCTPPELGLDILCLEDLGKVLIHNYLVKQAPSLFIPYTATIKNTRDPPDPPTRDAITEYLGRPLPWDREVWDGSMDSARDMMLNTFGNITWNQGFYMHKHYNVRMGGEAVKDHSCKYCGIPWTFWFAGPCPLCIPPTYSLPNVDERIKRGLRIIRNYALGRLIFINLYYHIQAKRSKALSPTSTDKKPRHTPLHVIILKGYSALFTIQDGTIANIGFQTTVRPDDNVFAKAAELIRATTNITANASDLVAYPSSADDGSNILFYPSIERDIWVRLPGNVTEAEFGDLNTLKYLRLHGNPAVHRMIIKRLTYIFDDPRAQYEQIMARCHVCRSLGPIGSKCNHDPKIYGSKAHYCRLETPIVGFLQGRQADCHMCGQQT